MEIDIAIYDSRGKKIYGFDADSEFVISFDDGIWWYYSFDVDNILVGCRLDNIRYSQSDRRNRIVALGRIPIENMDQLNIKDIFLKFISSVQKFIDENNMIWEEEVISEDVLNEIDTKMKISNMDEEDFLYEILLKLIIEEKAYIYVKDVIDINLPENSMKNRLITLSYAQNIVSYLKQNNCLYDFKILYGYSSLKSNVVLTNERSVQQTNYVSLIGKNNIKKLLDILEYKNIPPWEFKKYVTNIRFINNLPLSLLPVYILFWRINKNKLDSNEVFEKTVQNRVLFYLNNSFKRNNYDNIRLLEDLFYDDPKYLLNIVNNSISLEPTVLLCSMLCQNYNNKTEKFISEIYLDIPESIRLGFLKVYFRKISPNVGLYNPEFKEQIEEDLKKIDSAFGIIKPNYKKRKKEKNKYITNKFNMEKLIPSILQIIEKNKKIIKVLLILIIILIILILLYLNSRDIYAYIVSIIPQLANIKLSKIKGIFFGYIVL